MTVEEVKATEDAVALERFERLVFSQQPAREPWAPVTPFDYESRKAVEGRHPALIQSVLQPTRVLDYGAGYGHLVRLLRELGVKANGYEPYVQMEPDTRRYRLTCLFDADGDPVGHWDLVICREVLEHCTLRQIRAIVADLCTLSSRYVYVTTRFHPHPMSLLDVATHDDLDPTHITMLNQTFLRVLFVLEGFRRRADLETQLDWMQKGRCLVYERV